MPELPEVETVRKDLADKITGRAIQGVWTDTPAMLRGQSVSDFAFAVNGARVNRVSRRGKYLLIVLSNGLTMVAHLKMTGQLLVVANGEPVERWTHAIIELYGGHDLRFRDIRKFGYLELIKTVEIGADGETMPNIGPEPLESWFHQGCIRLVG